MTGFLRRAGSAGLADGARLEWTVADGSRGRRWRAVASVDDHITHALLLEVGRDGTVARLELTTPAGLLTLHPEADASTLHGNIVSSTGVRHLGFAWSADRAIVIIGRPIADAVTAHRLSATVGLGEWRDLRTVAVRADLAVEEGTMRVERLGPTAWRFTGSGGDRRLAIDARGIPFDPDAGVEWPLELD